MYQVEQKEKWPKNTDGNAFSRPVSCPENGLINGAGKPSSFASRGSDHFSRLDRTSRIPEEGSLAENPKQQTNVDISKLHNHLNYHFKPSSTGSNLHLHPFTNIFSSSAPSFLWAPQESSSVAFFIVFIFRYHVFVFIFENLGKQSLSSRSSLLSHVPCMVSASLSRTVWAQDTGTPQCIGGWFQ